jgi:hypothetical protein
MAEAEALLALANDPEFKKNQQTYTKYGSIFAGIVIVFVLALFVAGIIAASKKKANKSNKLSSSKSNKSGKSTKTSKQATKSNKNRTISPPNQRM